MGYTETLGTEPSEIVRPTSVEEVIAVVRRAVESGKTVIPWGGGTAQTLGYLPRRCDIVLDTTALSKVVAHEYADLTLTVEAGATLATVQDALALHNQFLPLDPPFGERATVGGMIATNAFGPGSVGSGFVRDWLIGITVVDAQGRLVRGGGKVVKNVTGYDLPKIHVGALGTLGIVVEATFKVAPRPEATRAVVFTCLNPDFVPRLHDETAPALSLLRSTRSGVVLAVLYSGLSSVVESELSRAAAIATDAGEMALSVLPTGMLPPFDGTVPASPLVIRFQGPRSQSATRHNGIADLADWTMLDTLPDGGFTDAYLGTAGDAPAVWEQCRTWSKHQGIACQLLHAPVTMRGRGATLFSPLPTSLPLLRRLKETLDPNTTLNPGRFVGEI